jgi:predicted dinucleotide-binding enzyme
MNIGVFGTGMVGETIATKLVALGHQVMMGSRSAQNEKAAAWVTRAGTQGSQGSFADAASHGDVLFNCTHGQASLEVLKLATAARLEGKVLIDVANPLARSKDGAPMLSVCNDDSLGEQIQRAYPALKVVKTLNTVNCAVMVDPTRIKGDHTMFLCGNDAGAKEATRQILRSFGWIDIIDLGDISAARATEALMPIWLRLWGHLKTLDFNLKVVR